MEDKKKMVWNEYLTDRELELLSGKDFQPITRREMYIRALYQKEQKVPTPMTREEQCFCIAIANIREEND